MYNYNDGMTTHLFVPDTQSKPGTPSDHLRWIGLYCLERRPDVIVHAGDHWDMASLSSWGSKKELEGRRYADDIEKGNEDFDLLIAPTRKYNARKSCRNPYTPDLHLLRGNHEFRVERAINDDPRLEGTIGYEDMESPGWTVHDFLKPVFIDSIAYCHFFSNPMSGRPIGGMMETRLKTIGHSFTAGHQQTLQTGIRFIQGPNGPIQQRGLVAGSCYLADELYRGPQGNAEWRGVIVKHEVEAGAYDLMEVSLDYLCRRYEGVDLGSFLRESYPEMDGLLWRR